MSVDTEPDDELGDIETAILRVKVFGVFFSWPSDTGGAYEVALLEGVLTESFFSPNDECDSAYTIIAMKTGKIYSTHWVPPYLQGASTIVYINF